MKKPRNPIAALSRFYKPKVVPDNKKDKLEAIQEKEHLTDYKSKELQYEFFQ